MDDSTFWDSSLEFICSLLDKYQDMHKKANKNAPVNKNKIEKNESVETQSLRKLSPQEIAELRAKAGK